MNEVNSGEFVKIEHGARRVTSIHTELMIDASPSHVWSVLTDFDKLPEWSPGLVRLEGNFEKDAEIVAVLKTGIGESVQKFKRRLVHFEPERLFGWTGPIMLGMHDNHKYMMEPRRGGTRFIQSDEVAKGAQPVFGRLLAPAMARSYGQFNRALKKRAEDTL